MPKRLLKLGNIDILDETAFKVLCFELLQELGFASVDWRKGTGLSTSPAYRGRDIVAQHERIDLDGQAHGDLVRRLQSPHQRSAAGEAAGLAGLGAS